MQPATLSGIISTAILACPRKQVTFKTLKRTTANIFSAIKAKREHTFVSNPPNHYDIAEAALSLGFEIEGNPTDRARGNQAILKLDAKKDSLLTLSLSYYKNQLASFVLDEAIVAQAVTLLNSEAQQNQRLTLQLGDIVDASQRVADIFRKEFISLTYDFDLPRVQRVLKAAEGVGAGRLLNESVFEMNFADKKPATVH